MGGLQRVRLTLPLNKFRPLAPTQPSPEGEGLRGQGQQQSMKRRLDASKRLTHLP